MRDFSILTGGDFVDFALGGIAGEEDRGKQEAVEEGEAARFCDGGEALE